MRHFLKRIVGDQAGATAVEYGLILSLVFLAMAGAAAGVGSDTSGLWKTVSDDMVNAS